MVATRKPRSVTPNPVEYYRIQFDTKEEALARVDKTIEDIIAIYDSLEECKAQSRSYLYVIEFREKLDKLE